MRAWLTVLLLVLAAGIGCLQNFDGVRCDADHPCPDGYGCASGVCALGASSEEPDAGEVDAGVDAGP